MDYIYIIFLVLYQACFIIQLYYTIVIHQKLRAHKIIDIATDVMHPVSVIICARNEEENLRKNLSFVLDQDYPYFEVIVVNDCSQDDSGLVLREYERQYTNLKVVTIAEHKRFKHGKKFAATLGIKAAGNEYLVFTDADCRPSSVNWLRLMQRNFVGTTEIILGYSPYHKLDGFVNRLIRFETFYTALNYLSFAIAGNAYMGVGRNMAYTKSLFFKGKGFASHMHIPSGDDDLFVNQNASAINTVIEIHPDAHVWSDPKITFASYLNQKIRHMGAGRAYKTAHQLMLFLQTASAILFYICIAALVILKAQWWMIASVFLIRLGVQLLVYWPVFKKLNYKDLTFWYPLFDFIYYFYILVLNVICLFKKRVQWK